ncbi:PAS domain S-box protein [Hoeflea ulvae]|uniref:histidine kinase n=1 Tax=Hoeflea ulvae TaxID=2983764 RepID=A0ABT3YGU2_9HYPH|nr:PAS domain S-box protein [Hoeflea ulvae]MCY0095123.1 PAS domain S-box protein [Hoeflea ulvae]
MAISTENLLRAMYDSLADPVIIGDSNRKIIAANAAAAKTFGYTVDEILQMNPSDFYASTEDFENVGKEMYPLTKESGRVHQRVNFRRKDGSIFAGELSFSQVLAEDGRPVGMVGIIRDLTEILAAQEERLRAEKILKTALASIPEGFVVYDEQDRLILCNDAYRELYPLAAPAMQVGATFETIVRYGLKHGQYPEAGDTEESQEAWLKARLERHFRPASQFIQQIAPDKWLQIDEIVTEENYRVGVRTDVSALTRIKSEAEQLGLVIEGVGQEVYLFDVNSGTFLSVNKSARDNLQYSTEELRRMSARDINKSLSEKELEDVISQMLAGQTKFVDSDWLHQRKDGSTYMCRVRLELMDSGPSPVILAFGEDITERLELEQEMQRKRHEFEALVRSLPDMITRSAPDTTLRYVNEHYAGFVGFKPEEMVGRKFIEFIPEEIRQNVWSHLSALTPEKPMDSYERAMRDHKGRRHWFIWTNQMMFRDGEPVELVSVGRDITESYKAKERIARQTRELAKRNDALEQFAGIVSHDLKAPLRQIRLFSEMMAEDVADGKTDELAEYSAHISERGRAMEQMISSLLEYSQLAYQAIKPKTFKLSEAIGSAWNNLAINAIETGARLSGDVDAEVHADLNLLIQLFQNLFANSMKYRDEAAAPEIRVAVTNGQSNTSIAVEDNGIGIDPKYAEHVFGVFQRLHRDERQYSGSGIGLSLCRRIAESHGGSIVIDPDFTGGTRFVITLPNGRNPAGESAAAAQ